MSTKKAFIVCTILSSYLVVLFSKRSLSCNKHTSNVFIFVAIMYGIFWKESYRKNNLGTVVFLISLLCFLFLVLSEKTTHFGRICYFFLASFTVVELWALGTCWCCKEEKSIITYCVISKML